MIDRVFGFLDDRLAISRSGRKMLDYIFPDHWSFLLGEIALYSFLVLVVTGIFLTLYFIPSTSDVIYHGPYAPLRGQSMSVAYKTTIDLSFSVRFGLLARQAHHWAANIFLGAIVVHMVRIFFTGAFRRPRELNWTVGLTLLLLSMTNGYMGYSLPDDLMSGTGVRIGFSIVESIPIVGSYLAFFLYGGNFPGPAIERRFYILHVLIVPLIIAGLIGAHLMMIIKAHHMQFPEQHTREDNVVGTPMWPGYAAKSVGFMCTIAGLCFALAAAVQINPIWHYGPYEPYLGSDASQPDWYVGWLEGAMRLWPPWETHLPGHMVPAEFFPAVALPVCTWAFFYVYPYIESWLSGDRAEHHLLDEPRHRPLRTAFGASVLSFFLIQFMAGSDDVVAGWLKVSISETVWTLRIASLVVPVIVFAIAWKLCHELAGGPVRRSRTRLHLAYGDHGYVVSAVADHSSSESRAPVELD